jgi:hypothetical protein
MALYILIALVSIGLLMLHSIDASLGRVLGALQNIHEGIESLVENSEPGNSRSTLTDD